MSVSSDGAALQVAGEVADNGDADHTDDPAMQMGAHSQQSIPPELQSMPSRDNGKGEHTPGVSSSRRRSLESKLGERESIMGSSLLGDRFGFNLAESAAFSGNPLGFASAVGRDVGNMLFGTLGFGAKPENNPEMCAQGACSFKRADLKRQADKLQKEHEKRRQHAAARRAESTDNQEEGGRNAKIDTSRIGEGNDEEHNSASSPGGIGKSGSLQSLDSTNSTDQNSTDKDGKDAESLPPDFNRSSTGSHVSGDITVSGIGHYNPKNDVILRLETMTSGETRFLVVALWSWLTIAFIFLLYNFSQKIIDRDGALRNYNQAKINIGLGTFALVAITVVLSTHTFRICYNIKQGKTWKPRRRKVTVYTSVELVVQWINLFCFVYPNYEMLGPRCPTQLHTNSISYFSLVRWTCWNTLFLISLIHAHNSNIVSVKRSGSTVGHLDSPQLGRQSSLLKTSKQVQYKDCIVNDMPFMTYHWWKLVLWVIEEAIIIVCCVYYGANAKKLRGPVHLIQMDCGEVNPFACAPTNTEISLASAMVLGAIVYFFLYCLFILKAFQQLKEKSSSEFRIANQVVRLQVRLRLPAFTLFTLSMLLLWYVRPFTCTSFFHTWMGLLPGQLAASGCVFLTMFVTTPKLIWDREKPPVLQVWLQEFSWTEEDKPRKLDRRNHTMAADEKHLIEKQPMFCVETMMKCLYWSLLIYDFEEVKDSRLTLDEACSLFHPPLHNYETFWEKSLDTKMILAWSRKRILLSFRGTASLANVMADIQAWRTPHYPKRNTWTHRPMVHSGFDKAWRNNGLNDKVLAKIEELYKQEEVDKDARFVVTGHSLGGALATLAAYDVRRLGRKHGCDAEVTCITFGAPRTGNHAFARDFEEMVPDCWHIINDQDVVARGGKFLVVYKRGGHRVLINKLGDMIVRPNPMETSMRLLPCTGSVQQHLLTSYMQSLQNVLLAQFSQKHLSGGMQGVVNLVRNSVPIKRILMEEQGLELKDLIHMARWGHLAPKLADVAKFPMTGRKSGAAQLDMKSRTMDDSAAMTTRGGFFCGCCAPIAVKIKEAKSGGHAQRTGPEEDANIRDGGDTTANGSIPDAGTDLPDKEKA